RGGKHFNSVAVLDENADYQQIGSNIQQIESQQLRMAVEARICGAFGVPPLLVSALVGLAFVNQRSSAREAQGEFWQNKMSPVFKRIRNFLTWNLLTEFEDREELFNNRVRLNWDLSQVASLQEMLTERDQRVRENFKAGIIKRSRAQALLGE